VVVKDAFNKKDVVAQNTIITPNHDGMNDCLCFKDIEAYGQCELVVYDRWGKEVERMENYQNDWAGTSKGQDLKTGTYFYVIKGEGIETKGCINILRE
jgi:gliding motility-associated-like protein